MYWANYKKLETPYLCDAYKQARELGEDFTDCIRVSPYLDRAHLETPSFHMTRYTKAVVDLLGLLVRNKLAPKPR